MKELYKNEYHKTFEKTQILPYDYQTLGIDFLKNMVETSGSIGTSPNNFLGYMTLQKDSENILFEWAHRRTATKYTKEFLAELPLDNIFSEMVSDDFIANVHFVFPMLEKIRILTNSSMIRIVGTPQQISKVYI